MARGETSPAILTTAERRAFVLVMRKTGATYRKIAAATASRFGADNLPEGWDERYAYKDVMRELARLRETMGEDGETVRQIELERLDRLTEALWPRAKDGDEAAIDKVLRIMDRRAKFLGLNRPEGLEVSGPGGAPLATESVVRIVIPDNGRGPVPDGMREGRQAGKAKGGGGREGD